MIKFLLIGVGTISLGLGITGIIFPVLPTTPFLLLSLTCYMRSSRKLYEFVLANKYLSPYLRDYVTGKGIPLKAKKKAIFLIWLTIGFSILFVIDKIFFRLILFTIASMVSICIWTRRTSEDRNIVDVGE